MAKHIEADLYEPVKALFEAQGFCVRAEVKRHDLVGTKDDEVIIAELKLQFGVKLLTQAIEAQKIADFVYVVIPRPKLEAKRSSGSREWKQLLHLLKRLDLGLITVALDSPVKKGSAQLVQAAAASPERRNNYRRRGLVLEANSRSKDYNKGGINRRKIVTAYREKSVEAACIAANGEGVSLKALRALGFSDKGLNVIRSNPYGWFVRISRGVYGLTDAGREALTKPAQELAEVTLYYKTKYGVNESGWI